jgi:hypothetical protein
VAKLSRLARLEIAKTRLLRILRSHGVASMRTLEMKISDAGPSPNALTPTSSPTRAKTLADIASMKRTRDRPVNRLPHLGNVVRSNAGDHGRKIALLTVDIMPLFLNAILVWHTANARG